jgi:hypothetical protein
MSVSRGCSREQLAIELLQRSVASSASSVLHHDLDHLIGTWVDDPAFDEALKEMDQPDLGCWL